MAFTDSLDNVSSYIASLEESEISDCEAGAFKLGKYSEREYEGDISPRKLVRVIYDTKD